MSVSRIPWYSKSLDILPKMLQDSIIKDRVRRVIDLGCGYGYLFYSLFHNKTLPRYSVAVDIKYENCRQLKKNIPGITVICGDICKVIRPKEFLFDYAICEQVIEHVQDEPALLMIIRKLIRDKGKLYISSIIRKKHAQWFYRYNGEVRLNPKHIREYNSEEEFTNLLEDNGFKIIKSQTTKFPFPLFDWLEIFLINFKLVTSESLNRWYERFPLLRFMKKRLVFLIPGFYIIEALAEKV